MYVCMYRFNLGNSAHKKKIKKTKLLLLISYKEYNMNKQTTQCIKNSAVRESYSETVQSAEIISLISDSWRKLSGR